MVAKMKGTCPFGRFLGQIHGTWGRLVLLQG